MRFTLTSVILVVLVLPTGLAIAQDSAASGPGLVRPMVAVLPFESGDLPQTWRWTWGGHTWPAGMGITDLLARELQRELRGRPVVLADPEALYRVLLERGLQREDGLPMELAGEIARAHGAQYFVTGRIGLTNLHRTISPLRLDQDWYLGYVTLDALLVDARSLRPLAILRGKASWRQIGRGWKTGDRTRVDLSGGFFAGSWLGRATGVAIRTVAADVEQRLRPLAISGEWLQETGPAVIAVDGRRTTINIGRVHGTEVGQTFEVRRAEDATVVGTVTIDEVGEVVATGRIVYSQPGLRARVGDVIAFGAG